ncbi:helix-turn-helix domain-containing protein [Mucilaginibacter sp. 3215]|uniref:helix-turn-helix domain-containing protein n=1 Tax=Mucilaginibacter sp. 3215 TaxID=3373912 RepID=UPI003D1DE5D3
MTQSDLGEKLGGISKQAVSKIEQSEDIDDERLKDIAFALGVTFDGLKNFNEEKVLYNTINFYENSGVSATTVSANVENVINNPLKEVIELYEKQLSAIQSKIDEALKRKD